MFGKFLFLSVAAITTVALLVVPASADTTVSITHGSTSINMVFVSVGNTDNAADGSYGAVDYPFNIGKYAVSKNQWDAVRDASTTDPLNAAGGWSGNQPVATISWYQAAMFCNWLTSGDATDGAYAINGSGEVTGINRAAAGSHGTVFVIPTENEWYKAAYYDGGASVYYDYATGSDSVPDGIDHAGDTEFDAVFSDPYSQNEPNDIDNAGALLSPYGTMGQSGNGWEWNETLINTARGKRGGAWQDNYHYIRSAHRSSFVPSVGIPVIGFRVASVAIVVPEPAGITLLLCGLASLICLRRRR
ncbi:MAG: SUMF1/EgtB/PvdO family nonheme iron enzyme [Planctomycetota bacterium]|nr:SUMF1/EgtB/PvdO family nonheme iron enzyme [Planctomycetota bacterium]